MVVEEGFFEFLPSWCCCETEPVGVLECNRLDGCEECREIIAPPLERPRLPSFGAWIELQLWLPSGREECPAVVLLRGDSCRPSPLAAEVDGRPVFDL